MEYQARISNKPKYYAKISLNKRMALVELVIDSKMSMSRAAQKLNIKRSTAKLIIAKYKEDGTFFEKRSDRLARLAEIKNQPQIPQILNILPQEIPQQPPMEGSLAVPPHSYWCYANPLTFAGQNYGYETYPFTSWMGFNNISILPAQNAYYGSFY